MATNLEVGIGLRDKLTGDLKKSLTGIRRFTGGAKKLFSGLGRQIFSLKGLVAGIATGVAIRGISRLVLGVSETLDATQKLSIRLGESTEFLSEFGFVAERSGVKLKTVEKSLQNLAKNLGEFRRTGTGEGAQAFEALGLEQAARSAQNLEQFLPVLANAIRGLGDDFGKTEAAARLFGGRGVELLQILKGGGDEIRTLRRRARELGVTISQDLADNAAKFQDSLTDLRRSIFGVFKDALGEGFPAFTSIVKELTDLVIQNKAGVVGFFRDLFVEIRKNAPSAIEAIKGIANALGVVAKTAAGITVDVTNAVTNAAFDVRLGAARKSIEALKRQLRDFDQLKEFGFVNTPEAKATFEGAVGKLRKELTKAKGELQDATREAGKFREAIGQIPGGGTTGGFFKASQDPIDALRDRIKKSSDGLKALRAQIDSGSRFRPSEIALAERDKRLFGDRGLSDIERVEAVDAARKQIAGLTSNIGPGPFDEVPASIGQVTEATIELKTATDGAREALQQYLQDSTGFELAKFAVDRFTSALEDGVVSAIGSVVDGTRTLKQAFSDMARGILSDISRIITRLIVVRTLSTIISGIGGAISGGISPATGARVDALGNPIVQGPVTEGGVGPIAIPVVAPAGKTSPVVIQNVTTNIQATDANSFNEQWAAAFEKRQREVTESVLERFNSSRSFRERFA